MNQDRLQTLIDVLRIVSCQDLPFDMGAWTSVRSGEPCRTSACALGYAALDSRFQAMGLTLVNSHDPRQTFWTAQEVNAAIRAQTIGSNMLAIPTYEGEQGFEAGSSLFDISARASTYLFDPDSYPRGYISPDDVIERVHEVVMLGGDAPDPMDDDEDC